ncbi:hypothetical protein V7P26_07950 [Arcobacter cryaerophilus gv. pseudocryaerophilus]|jgi:hypothetical protein|uniref:hypothetical protein n=1 Tax=Aliarcobacter cryaerophilus TaxID=28198 RepID=UPI00112F4485|nr:hypothetical protein [Aliarcobacter cryaerophilus]MBP6713749.1 hypothetical protein [Aliarcobacter sp.]MBP7226464.1 hypothetical protein [Aliarcobacter sp.]MBP7748893.1 hypothetical protein [Aliarcobacter sp.]
MKKITFFLLVLGLGVAFAGTGDAYGAKPIFDKVDAALGDTYIGALLALGFLWKAYGIYKETGDSLKALPQGALGLGIGSLTALASGISGAILI